MSSIRLFILGSLAERGPMHGHALVALAEEEHVANWTDISVGGIYGAVRRLAAEDLIAVTRTEKQGNYPERQIYAITDAGREALRGLQGAALHDLVWRHDPVDLGLARLDPDTLDALPHVIEGRRIRIAEALAHLEERIVRITDHLTIAERQAMRHGIHRLRAELAWHDELLDALPDVLRDERTRQRDAPPGKDTP